MNFSESKDILGNSTSGSNKESMKMLLEPPDYMVENYSGEIEMENSLPNKNLF